MDDFFFSTGAIWKERQHEVTNITKSSSHDKKVIPKKSMALRKEYIQGNASFNTPIKQVKQYIEEVEISMFFMTIDTLIT